MLARKNFGCGSSREHAPWAILDYGLKCIISSSFADIFYNNCRKNGVLAIVLQSFEIQSLFEEVDISEGCELTEDLPKQIVSSPKGNKYHFEIDSFAKSCLLNGMDDIDWTLQYNEKIRSYEERTRRQKPWLFLNN